MVAKYHLMIIPALLLLMGVSCASKPLVKVNQNRVDVLAAEYCINTKGDEYVSLNLEMADRGSAFSESRQLKIVMEIARSSETEASDMPTGFVFLFSPRLAGQGPLRDSDLVIQTDGPNRLLSGHISAEIRGKHEGAVPELEIVQMTFKNLLAHSADCGRIVPDGLVELEPSMTEWKQ